MAPKTATKTASASASASTKAPAAEPVPTPSAKPNADAIVTPVTDVNDLNTRFETLLKAFNATQTQLRDAIATLKTLQKETTRVVKSAGTKKGRKAANADGKPAAPRTPSGFAKPTPLSAELCTFLGVPAGTQLARTEVTKLITKYIKEKNLQDPADKRTIKPDAALQKLMQLAGKDVKLTYFNLQTHMKHHFVKA